MSIDAFFICRSCRRRKRAGQFTAGMFTFGFGVRNRQEDEALVEARVWLTDHLLLGYDVRFTTNDRDEADPPPSFAGMPFNRETRAVATALRMPFRDYSTWLYLRRPRDPWCRLGLSGEPLAYVEEVEGAKRQYRAVLTLPTFQPWTTSPTNEVDARNRLEARLAALGAEVVIEEEWPGGGVGARARADRTPYDPACPGGFQRWELLAALEALRRTGASARTLRAAIDAMPTSEVPEGSHGVLAPARMTAICAFFGCFPLTRLPR